MNKPVEDSKKLWLKLRSELPKYDIRLGVATGQSYIYDPKHIVFHASRYKFVAKMLDGMDSVLEIGCADGFGAPIVAQGVKKLICTDIDDELIRENKTRLSMFNNIDFIYHDFRASSLQVTVDGVYMIDVLEHVFSSEENSLLTNAFTSLSSSGVAVIGTPNLTAERFASKHSKTGHVNLKDHSSLRALCLKYFRNVFMFSMNDEVIHTGFSPMSHYIWAVCASPIE